MLTSTVMRSTNKFLGEVHERDGIGLRYVTAAGGTGVVWLVEPSDPEGSMQPRLTVLGRYLHHTGVFTCQKGS